MFGVKVGKILKGSLDLIPSPSFSVKIQIMNGKVCLGAIFILRKDIEVGGWSRKWQFSLTLCGEM